jgi:cell wall-associated NlpC family hydrolase
VRPVVRLKSRSTAVILALITALLAGVALVGLPQLASAQTPVPAFDPTFNAAPMTAGEKSALMLAATQELALAQAKATRLHALAVRQSQARKVQQLRMRIVTIAKNQIGDRYSAGASGPSAFDCSGLTRYVYKLATGKELPHQSHAQFARVKRITRASAEPGDLVFFFRGGAHHVGVYIGNGRMVDAAGYGEGVRISPISGSWWSRTYSGMGRLLPA